MNYSQEKSIQSFKSRNMLLASPMFSQLRKAYTIFLTDATTERRISMTASALTLRQL